MSSKGKIEKSGNLAHADRILREVRKIWPKAWEGWLKCWANGREQGYWIQASLWLKTARGAAACVFSEGRSCDGALIVVGRPTEFNYQTNQPSEKLWDDPTCRQYFYDTTGLRDPDGSHKTWNKSLRGRGDGLAAKWLVKRLRELIKEDLAENRERARACASKARAS